MPVSSHPPGFHCSAPGGSSPAGNSSPRWERESGVNNQLLQLFGEVKEPIQLYCIQRSAKLRCIETARNMEEKQRISISHASGATAVFGELLAEVKKPMDSTATVDSLQILPVFTPQVFPDISHLNPSQLPPYPQPLPEPRTHTSSRFSLLSCISARHQPRPYSCAPLMCAHSVLAPPGVHQHSDSLIPFISLH